MPDGPLHTGAADKRKDMVLQTESPQIQTKSQVQPQHLAFGNIGTIHHFAGSGLSNRWGLAAHTQHYYCCCCCKGFLSALLPPLLLLLLMVLLSGLYQPSHTCYCYRTRCPRTLPQPVAYTRSIPHTRHQQPIASTAAAKAAVANSVRAVAAAAAAAGAATGLCQLLLPYCSDPT